MLGAGAHLKLFTAVHHVCSHIRGAGPGVAGRFEMYPELGYTAVILSNYELPAIMPIIMKTRGLILNQ
jgi:hypothetical protein